MDKMFWLDLEMTGLEPQKDRILEAAAIVTNTSFEVLGKFEGVVKQSEELLNGMDAWCKEHHGASGLLDRIPTGMAEQELDKALANLARQTFGSERVILCGNSIWQDRRFVERYLPEFSSMLHYRMVDVSSFKMIFEKMLGKKYEKKNAHRALEDIEESISEFRFYLSFIDPAANLQSIH